MSLQIYNQRWAPTQRGQVIILDNRDSFVFNLVHRFYEVGLETRVLRSDATTLEALEELDPAGLVLSPGPGHPRDAGVSVAAIARFHGQVPILGICLGHQAMAAAFGADVAPSGQPRHGKPSTIAHDGRGLFEDAEHPLEVGRYHSLVVREASLPPELEVSARCDGWVMGLRHRQHPTFGLQFHPESILTPQGRGLLARFTDRLT